MLIIIIVIVGVAISIIIIMNSAINITIITTTDPEPVRPQDQAMSAVGMWPAPFARLDPLRRLHLGIQHTL